MTDISYEDNYVAHCRVFQDAEKCGEIKFHTLSSLGFKRSVDAAHAGYILVRKSFALGQRTMPAVWLAPEDLSKFEQILQRAEHGRRAEKEQQLSQHEKKQAALQQLMQDYPAYQQQIANDELKRQPKRAVERIKADVDRLHTLMMAISSIAERGGISLDTPIAAIKSKFCLRYTADVEIPGVLGFQRTYSLSLPATSSTSELHQAIQTIEQQHAGFSRDIRRFMEVAHQWRHIVPWACWMGVFKKAKESAWSFAEMVQRAHQGAKQDSAAAALILSACTRALQDLSEMPSGMTVVVKHGMVSLLTGQGLEIQGFSLDAGVIHAMSMTSDTLHPEGAILQCVSQEVVSSAIRCAEHFREHQHRLRGAISTTFDDETVIGTFYRFTPKTIQHRHLESVLSAATAQTIAHFSSMLSISDLIKKYGDDWVVSRYLHARAIDRRIVIYAGPTNSGKTYSAYKAVEQAQSVLYLAPLRLLAMEGYDKLRSMGFEASLLTGEERIGKTDARYVASTVEMCNPNRLFEAAIIDEAQMLCDPDRGSAWTAAILGVPAKNVYLTCPEESVEMLLSLLRLTNENVEVVRLERKSTLAFASQPTPVKNVKPGTAFIAFSRRELLEYKEVFESRGFKCALVYGALSPEVRRGQAELFNSGAADILLSTDAISMGLNLPIQQVVISDSKKFNGKTVADIEPALLRQIAGRAGRYGLKENGVVSGISVGVHKAISQAFAHITPFHLEKYPVGLDQDMAEILSAAYHTNQLSEIYTHFKKVIESSASDFTAKCPPLQLTMFGFVDSETLTRRLPLAVRFTASCAPVNDDNYGQWANWVDRLADGIATPAPQRFTPAQITGDARVLKQVEEDVALLNLYRWMHYQFPEAFPELDIASARLKEKDAYIHESLKSSIRKRCGECGCTLPMQWLHARCDDCYHGGRGYST